MKAADPHFAFNDVAAFLTISLCSETGVSTGAERKDAR
jgi:hypothetical protein